MSNRKRQESKEITGAIAGEVARACLCLHVQRAARALARHFDDVFRPLDLTSGQYSLLMSLNRPAPTMGETARFLAMDRTTLTAALKSLERRGLVAVRKGAEDKRTKRLHLTAAGSALLAEAYPLWCAAHGAIEAAMSSPDAETTRSGLLQLTRNLERAASD